MRLFIIRPRIRRGIDLLKEEKEKEEEAKPRVKVKPKKKVRKVITKKPEPVTGSIMDDFRSIADYDITDEQLELELKKLEKIKISR